MRRLTRLGLRRVLDRNVSCPFLLSSSLWASNCLFFRSHCLEALGEQALVTCSVQPRALAEPGVSPPAPHRPAISPGLHDSHSLMSGFLVDCELPWERQ